MKFVEREKYRIGINAKDGLMVILPPVFWSHSRFNPTEARAFAHDILDAARILELEAHPAPMSAGNGQGNTNRR